MPDSCCPPPGVHTQQATLPLCRPQGSKLLNSQVITPVLSLSPLSKFNLDDAQSSSAMSFSLDKSWLIISLADSSIKVFSTHSGVLARTLIGDESGMWVVCLVGKGGEVWMSRGKRMWGRSRKSSRRKRIERWHLHKSASTRESAMVTLIVDPDSKKARWKRDTE